MSGRIFITGDKHRTFIPLFGLAEHIELKNTDILMIAGDAGYVWDDHYLYDVETLQQIFPGTLVFIDGNHENHALLNRLKVIQWNGGKVHQVGQRVLHLMRGEIYCIYGRTFFTFGGARSVDKDRREEGISWWKEEEPTQQEMEYGKKQLLCHINEIDYVMTHESPLFARESISREKAVEEGYFLPKILEDLYHMLMGSQKFKKWYFGHMHTDQQITPKLYGIYHNILLLDKEKIIPWM